MRVIIDVASIELFADDGATVMTETFFPDQSFDRIELFAEGGDAELAQGTVHELLSIW
jgi:sucrose-6-phosphate hydrolase SacC (GH32 family)